LDQAPGFQELYDKEEDPDMLKNLAEDSRYTKIRDDLKMKLNSYLSRTNDPRMQGLSPWDAYKLDK
jgi:uncharacterized sulfatase